MIPRREEAMSPSQSLFRGTLLLGLPHTLAVACPDPPHGMDETGKPSLKLPRRPATREAVRARIDVEPLPRGARLVVRTPDGRIAASIAPVGMPRGQPTGTQTIPVPARAVDEDTESLRLEIHERGAASPPAPTRTEVESARLEIIPVTDGGRQVLPGRFEDGPTRAHGHSRHRHEPATTPDPARSPFRAHGRLPRAGRTRNEAPVRTDASVPTISVVSGRGRSWDASPLADEPCSAQPSWSSPSGFASSTSP